MSYTAKNIKILSEDEINKFPYQLLEELDNKYPIVCRESIQLGIEACLLSGYPIELYEQRYLLDKKEVEVTPEMLECYTSLVLAKRFK
jgi:hypothetical protein